MPGLVVIVAYWLLSSDWTLSVADDNTAVDGMTYEFSLRSREERPFVSLDEVRALFSR